MDASKKANEVAPVAGDDILAATSGAPQVEKIDSDAALERGIRQQELDDRKQDSNLKKLYAKAMLAILGVQLVAVDGVFVAYAWAGKDWDIPDGVMQAWFGATVLQVVGITLVVTRYLFPNRDSK